MCEYFFRNVTISVLWVSNIFIQFMSATLFPYIFQKKKKLRTWDAVGKFLHVAMIQPRQPDVQVDVEGLYPDPDPGPGQLMKGHMASTLFVSAMLHPRL